MFATPAMASIVVDGSLTDWGITVGDSNNTVYTLLGPSIGLISSMIEDQDDFSGHGFFLGPNYGGQDYDAEFLGVAYKSGKLYVAILTGQRPDNGLTYFGPGDIRIETSGGVYGVEVGGGPGGGPGTAITEGAPGSTYQLKSNGETQSHSVANASQTAGSMWKNVNWIMDPIAPPMPTQFSILPTSTLIGAADYVYTRNSQTLRHAAIELGLDVSLFNGELIKGVTWRPGCGNDELSVPVNIVPEPVTASFLAAGWLLFGFRRRRVV
ncbi:MAG TPA: hypothetical protein VLM89_02665 [Phycisphaerae bacterium]|nr:hypothetical protein [Phycisphaerae bacterium]